MRGDYPALSTLLLVCWPEYTLWSEEHLFHVLCHRKYSKLIFVFFFRWCNLRPIERPIDLYNLSLRFNRLRWLVLDDSSKSKILFTLSSLKSPQLCLLTRSMTFSAVGSLCLATTIASIIWNLSLENMINFIHSRVTSCVKFKVYENNSFLNPVRKYFRYNYVSKAMTNRVINVLFCTRGLLKFSEGNPWQQDFRQVLCGLILSYL